MEAPVVAVLARDVDDLGDIAMFDVACEQDVRVGTAFPEPGLEHQGIAVAVDQATVIGPDRVGRVGEELDAVLWPAGSPASSVSSARRINTPGKRSTLSVCPMTS